MITINKSILIIVIVIVIVIGLPFGEEGTEISEGHAGNVNPAQCSQIVTMRRRMVVMMLMMMIMMRMMMSILLNAHR